MARNLTEKLIASHLVSGKMVVGEEIGLSVEQTLTQDATGTMVMLELEAMGLKKVKTELSAQYVDHNLLEADYKNADDHIFLESACERFGIWYSRAGNGVSHPVHMERFGIPGKMLVGSDSHTCAAGSLGMLAIGMGGLEVAQAMMGEPVFLSMPAVFGLRLVGDLPDYVSAKDVILEIIRRYSVSGGVNKVLEYYGPGLKHLSAMDRHVIANMGAELGATTSVFPSDEITKEFLKHEDRKKDWQELHADKDAHYDQHDEIDLSALVPLIACPSSPDKVVPVREVAGLAIYQSMIGSSANPGMRDFAVPAMMVDGKKIHPRVSFDINPTSRRILEKLVMEGYLASFIRAGARIHQAGCNGCIGMGQAPGTNSISLRTVPRNFPGRSGTQGDLVYLCSPETAAASALTGVITDPRDMDKKYPKYREKKIEVNSDDLVPPTKASTRRELVMGPNIKPLPRFEALSDSINGPVVIKLGDHISTDEILPAGSKVLPFRSNIPEIARFTFINIDGQFYERCVALKKTGALIIAGSNYGQGSSREHAAIVTRYLGIKAIVAKSYARIHRDNLIHFGVAPFLFEDPSAFDGLDQNDVLLLENIKDSLLRHEPLVVHNQTKKTTINIVAPLSTREREILLAGGLIRWFEQTKNPS